MMNVDLAIILQFLDRVKEQTLAGFIILGLFAVGYIIGRTEAWLNINRDFNSKLPKIYVKKLNSQAEKIKEQAKRIEELETERVEHITYINYLITHRRAS